VSWASLAAAGATAEPSAEAATEVRRGILALYDSAREGAPAATRIHRFAELPLNHLGYVLTYHDVRGPLPPPDETRRNAGVLSWLIGPVAADDAGGDRHLGWLRQVAAAGTRLIVLGEIGASLTQRNRRLADSAMAPLGVRHAGTYVSPAGGTRVVARDARFYDFECRLDPVLPDYPVLERVGPESRPILEVQAPDEGGGRRSSLVTIGPGGGIAAFGFEFCHQAAPLHRGRWLIDPFAFFHAALAAPRSPVPDTTTLSGRRMYFSIVGGDGWSTSVETRGQRQPGELAAQIVVRDLIEAFPELPVTLDLDVRDVEMLPRNASAARAVADRALALPQVSRPGVHAVASRLSRLDASFDSISDLAPLSVTAGTRVLLAATSSERGYLTVEPRSALHFFSLQETIARTGEPRRLKPANINYHVSVAADRALLGILRRHQEAMRASPIVPVPASLYAQIAEGFFTARIDAIGERAWRIRERGMLQTLRFDDAEAVSVDLAASRGVIGQSRHGGSLYVALDAAVDPAEVVLCDCRPDDGPSLVSSRWWLRKAVRGPDRITVDAQGLGTGEFEWHGRSGATYHVVARRGTDVLWTGRADADPEGRFAITIPIAALEPLSLEIAAAGS
jgi:hypothetical protein